jgi:hypothetical protein
VGVDAVLLGVAVGHRHGRGDVGVGRVEAWVAASWAGIGGRGGGEWRWRPVGAG